jgi:predicted DNA-binding transcriptional regulator AlpA
VVRVIDKQPHHAPTDATTLDERKPQGAAQAADDVLWPSPDGPPVLWRLLLVLRLTGMKATQIYDAVEKGLFPKPIKLLPGGRANCWVAQEIVKHIEARIKQRDDEIAVGE